MTNNKMISFRSQFAHSEDILSPSHGVDKSVTLLMQRLPLGASIFDIGAGEGRNSIPLAQAGYQIMVADKKLTKLRSEAILQNIHLQYYEGDITKYIFDQTYDAFVCMRVLHFLSPHDAHMLLESMKINTYSKIIFDLGIQSSFIGNNNFIDNKIIIVGYLSPFIGLN